MRHLSVGGVATILCLGAHSDDIEIGAGATLLRLARHNPAVRVVWVVLSATGRRREEADASATRFLHRVSAKNIILKDFRDGHFPHSWSEIKEFLQDLIPLTPDLILTHYGADLHQDHRIVSEVTWNTFRNHTILEYEVPKYDGGLGSPNVFVPVSREEADLKCAILAECFPSQSTKHWFDDLTFRGLMRLRGLECCAADNLAEAFYARKLTVDLTAA